MSLPVEYEPYQRQPEEPAEDYALFVEWCKIPPSSRNIQNMSRRVSIATNKLSHLHKKWSWDARALAYDNAALSLRPDPRSMDEEASIATQLAASAMLLELGLTAIQLKDPSRISVSRAESLIGKALEIQRKALGEADFTMRVEHDDLSRVNKLIEEIWDVEVEEDGLEPA